MQVSTRIGGFVIGAWLCGCAATHAATAPSVTSLTPAGTAAAATQQARPVAAPSDPRELVPADAQLVAMLDLSALAQAPGFTTWRRWTQEHSCVKDSDLQWLLAQSSHAMLIARQPAEHASQWLLVLQGSYGPQDLDRALDVVEQRGTLAPPGARAARTHALRKISTSGQFSVTNLDDKLLLAGDHELLDAALDALGPTGAGSPAQSKPARWFDEPALHALAERIDCAHKTLCVEAVPNQHAQSFVEKQLTEMGMAALGQSLSNAPSALSLDTKQGVLLQISSALASADAAQSVAKQVNDWLWQIGVFAHLAGFPDVLDAAKVRADASFVQLDFPLRPSDEQQLEQRLGSMLQRLDPPQCDATAVATGPRP